eukprot:CAMPEP_0174824506 /NCGR_PEP_ID=MMETSP1107-20130205/34930_1 /TAXON_ID=36770 /ORGANISM="Paraphysomonas vestita, Strain GFlagA" /LENGTH=51 /DNA_ID=CAMNT_0016052173 /DNA_START=140 /DNA_END=295 /DNA_ORIENTATION=-
MVLVNLLILMVIFMKESGMKVENKVKEKCNGKMVMYILVIGYKILLKVKVL